MEDPKRWYISSVAGSTISGAKGSELMAAVGAMVPSSTMRPTATPRAAYFRKRRFSPWYGSTPRARPPQGRPPPTPLSFPLPHVFAVSLPLLRIRDGVPALCVSRPAAVLKVVESMLAHVRVLDAAEVHPYVRVLVAEEGREAQESLVVERAPELVVGAGPARPGLLVDWVRGGAQREQVNEHRLVVTIPVEAPETPFPCPGEGDRPRARGGP